MVHYIIIILAMLLIIYIASRMVRNARRISNQYHDAYINAYHKYEEEYSKREKLEQALNNIKNHVIHT